MEAIEFKSVFECEGCGAKRIQTMFGSFIDESDTPYCWHCESAQKMKYTHSFPSIRHENNYWLLKALLEKPE